MKQGTTEYGLHVLFSPYLLAHCSLFDKLNAQTFKIPFSFIYGDRDWVMNIDDGCS
jgi:hypothetical protein